jgi:non-structural maintenance of chromosomes element 4
MKGSEDPQAVRGHKPRHQSILSIDMPTWREVIEVFDIKEPLIPHRQEQQTGGPGAKGWYS